MYKVGIQSKHLYRGSQLLGSVPFTKYQSSEVKLLTRKIHVDPSEIIGPSKKLTYHLSSTQKELKIIQTSTITKDIKKDLKWT